MGRGKRICEWIDCGQGAGENARVVQNAARLNRGQMVVPDQRRGTGRMHGRRLGADSGRGRGIAEGAVGGREGGFLGGPPG
eukprot:6906430-Prymnesium_polylepis.1